MGGAGRSWIEETIWGGVTVFVRLDFRLVSVDSIAGGVGAAQLKQKERSSNKDRRELQVDIGRLEGWRNGGKTKRGNSPAVLPILPAILLFCRFLHTRLAFLDLKLKYERSFCVSKFAMDFGNNNP